MYVLQMIKELTDATLVVERNLCRLSLIFTKQIEAQYIIKGYVDTRRHTEIIFIMYHMI